MHKEALNPATQKLLDATGQKREVLSRQIAELQNQWDETTDLVNWLRSPWNYGDIVEQETRTWKSRSQTPRRFVIIEARYVGGQGLPIKRDGTLSQKVQWVPDTARVVGQYTGDDLPDPPEVAVLAMKAKGGVALEE